MKNERCKIFCIYFKHNIDSKDLEYAGDLLKKIAKIGKTNDYYKSNSLESLYETFNKISDAIQTNYKLKLDK